MTADLEAAQAALQVADKHVRAAALGVMREDPAVAGLMVRVEKLQRDLLAQGGVLEWLIERNVFPLHDDTGRRIHTHEADQLEAMRFRMSFLGPWQFQVGARGYYPNGAFPEERGGRLKQIAAGPWADALEQLQRDASVSLPEMPK